VAGVAGYSDWQKVGATTPVPDPARTAIPIPSSSQPVPEQHSPVVSEKEFVKRLDAPADPDGSLSSEIDLWNTVATHRVFLALNNDQKYYIADGFIQKHILPLKEFQRLPLDHQERITGTLSQGLAIESNLL
jgi:hypothetical protein